MASTLARTLDILKSEGALTPSAVQGLSDMGGAAADELRRNWQSVTAERRRAVMHLAGSLADEHIELNFDRLAVIGLDDPDPAVRRQAIANLWESEDALLARRFLDCLEADSDVGVRAEAARALGRFVLEAEQEDVPTAERLRLEAALLSAATSTDERLRLRAVEALGFSSRPEVLSLIQAAYDSPGEEPRQSALLAMGRSGDLRWREIVMAELRSPAPDNRRAAARAAGELELRRSVPELIDLLDDVSPEVQVQAIWSLGQIGGKTAERALLRARRSMSDETARVAIDESLEYLTFLEGTRDLEAALRAQRESE